MPNANTSLTASPYGTLPPASPPATRKPVSLPRLADMHEMRKFVRNFMAEAPGVPATLKAYVRAVKDGSFPDDRLHAW